MNLLTIDIGVYSFVFAKQWGESRLGNVKFAIQMLTETYHTHEKFVQYLSNYSMPYFQLPDDFGLDDSSPKPSLT